MKLSFQTGLQIKNIWSFSTKFSHFLLFTLGSLRTLAFLFNFLRVQLPVLGWITAKPCLLVSCFFLLFSFSWISHPTTHRWYAFLLEFQLQTSPFTRGGSQPFRKGVSPSTLPEQQPSPAPSLPPGQGLLPPSPHWAPGQPRLFLGGSSLLPGQWSIFLPGLKFPTTTRTPRRKHPMLRLQTDHPAHTPASEIPPFPMEFGFRLHC